MTDQQWETLLAVIDGQAIDCTFFGPKARFHHIGLAVRSIRALNPLFKVYEETNERVYMSFISFYGIRIELLEPRNDQSPIARNLREGVKLLHLCYEVPDLDAALDACRPVGFHRLGRPMRAPLFEHRPYVWVFSREYGLFELVEQCRTSPDDREQ